MSLVRVDGESMVPKLSPGGFALFKKRKHYAAGDIVLVHHPRLGRIVKLIARRDPNGYWLEGCSSASISSEQMGHVSPQDVRGKLVWTKS